MEQSIRGEHAARLQNFGTRKDSIEFPNKSRRREWSARINKGDPERRPLDATIRIGVGPLFPGHGCPNSVKPEVDQNSLSEQDLPARKTISLSPFTSSMSAVRPLAKHNRCLREKPSKSHPESAEAGFSYHHMGASTSLGLEPD